MRHRDRAKSLLKGAVDLIHLLQIPLFLGLLLALVMFGATFFWAIIEAVITLEFLDRNAAILLVLDLLDMVFIANLIVMVMVSGYQAYFLEAGDPDTDEDLARRDSFAKVKARIAATLVIISGIHLVHELLADMPAPALDLAVLAGVHLVLLATAAVLVLLARDED
ncbi:MAG: YqhA family protein [Paracoccaceae bacterium]